MASLRFAGTALYPGRRRAALPGDRAEPLARRRSSKIENNHTRGDYREYFPRDLEPHFLTRGSDGEIYSIHPVGMPVLMAPVYAAGGYRGVVFAFVLMAAIAAG